MMTSIGLVGLIGPSAAAAGGLHHPPHPAFANQQQGLDPHGAAMGGGGYGGAGPYGAMHPHGASAGDAPAIPFGMGLGIADLAMGMAAAGVLPQNLHEFRPSGEGAARKRGARRPLASGAAAAAPGGGRGSRGEVGGGRGGVTSRLGALRVGDVAIGGADDEGENIIGGEGSVVSQRSYYGGVGGGGSVATGLRTQMGADDGSSIFPGNSASRLGGQRG